MKLRLVCICSIPTCTSSSPTQYEYLWADGAKYKKPTQMSAPQYMECLFDWVGSQLDDPKMFPQTFGEGFPPNFKEHVCTIFKRLFRRAAAYMNRISPYMCCWSISQF